MNARQVLECFDEASSDETANEITESSEDEFYPINSKKNNFYDVTLKLSSSSDDLSTGDEQDKSTQAKPLPKSKIFTLEKRVTRSQIMNIRYESNSALRSKPFRPEGRGTRGRGTRETTKEVMDRGRGRERRVTASDAVEEVESSEEADDDRD